MRRWCEYPVLSYNNTIFFILLKADSRDVTDISCTKRTEKTGLAILMTGQQLLVGQNKAAWDTRCWRDSLWNHLRDKDELRNQSGFSAESKVAFLQKAV